MGFTVWRGRFRAGSAAGRASVCGVAALAMAAQFIAGAAPAAAGVRGAAPTAVHEKSTPVYAVTSHYQKASLTPSWQPSKTVWPAGSGDAVLAAAPSARAASRVVPAPATKTQAGSLPLWVSQQSAAVASPLRVHAAVAAKETAEAAGVKGVLFTVARGDGAGAPATVHLTLSYAQFQDAFGGDWAARLALVQLPACAVTTPNVPACRVRTPVKFANDPAARTLQADVALPGAPTEAAPSAAPARSGSARAAVAAPSLVLAADSTTASDAGGGAGDFTATSLKASGSWQAGGSSDAFTWSYPIPVPAVPGGLQPKLSLSYDSQSVDGLTSSSNNQASWVGDGWSLSESYIERSYQSCHQNPAGTTQTWDECWSDNNALTLSLNGSTTMLVKDDATGTYRAANDSNERIQYLTGASNGARNGEYWVVTTTDGTQYWFGYNQLPGYTSGNVTTNSVWTEPVYATASGQPCYNSTWANSWCQQAYRWNLDYVVDTHSDAVSYWYTAEKNYYAQNNGTTAPTSSLYVRGGYLSKIQYGQRAGQVYSTTPAGEVGFTVNGRCDSSPTGCATSTLSSSSSSHWPDVPYDMNCASGASCSAQAPSFWTEYELTGIQTQALVGSTLTNVDSWALAYAFPPIANATDTTKPSLWLNSITQTGQDTTAGGSSASVPLPPVVFTGQAMQNRVNLTNGYPWITRQRMYKISTETGETITVNYSAPACGSATPSDDAQNTMLCYPDYWYPTGKTTPVKEYFNKYIVGTVTEQDGTGGSGNDTIVTTYTPVGSPAWHYNDNPLTPANQRTWDQFRGYSGMTVSTGTAPDPVTKATYTYFRGMNGDYLTSTTTRSASATDSRGDPGIADSNQWAGQTYETQIFNGSAVVTDTISDPWSSAATATHALSGGLPSEQSFLIGTARTRVYTTLAAGGARETETDFTRDGYGRVTQTNDLGDVNVPAQNLCTTTTYADNTGAWILDRVAESKTVSVNCSKTPSIPANAVSDTLTFYDGSSTLGSAPTVGDVTMYQKAASYSGSTPTYATTQTVTVDEYGRDIAVYDALGRKTTTTYTPATGAEPTSIAVTDALSHTTTTGYDALRELPVSKTDAAGYVTTEQYDALGRLTAVYKPGEASPNPPNVKYTYTVSNSAPSVVDTYTLNDDSTYRVSEVLYDSLLRSREVQNQTVDGGREISDTYYNTDGWQSETTDPYYNSSAVSTTYVQAPIGTVASATGYSYDAAGRKTAQIAYALGTQTWQTTYVYGGNFTTSLPPAGSIPTTTVTDARGHTTDLIQYFSGAPTNYVTDPASDYSDTKYTYTPDGKQATQTDAAGNTWTWAYNPLGYQTDAYDPDTGHTTTVYDTAGELTSSTDARGKQTTYVYDLDGRKSATYDTTTTQTLSSANQLTGYVYDTVKKGLLTSTTSYSNGDTYTSSVLAYGTLGKPSATKVTLSGEGTTLVPSTGYTTGYGYTPTGLLSSQSDPAMGGLPSENLKFTYDEFGEPIALTSTGGASWSYASAIGYSEYGQVQQYTMGVTGSNVWVKLGYDAQTRKLDDIQTSDSTASGNVDELAYTFGNTSGSVSKGSGLLTETVDAQNANTTVDTQCYTYDYAARLQQAWTATDNCAAAPTPGSSTTVGGTLAPYWQSWTYDAAGNRLTQTDHDPAGNTANDTTTQYNYPTAGSQTDQPHTLANTTATGPGASGDTASYGYDVSGETTSITGGTLGNQTLTWNDQGNLQSDTTSAGTTSYVYDADGNQIVRRDPGTTTFYAGDAQLTLTGTTVAGTRYYSVGGVTIAERTSAGAVSYLIPDRQGTDELAISAAATQTVTRRMFAPFGGARGGNVAWVGGDKGYVGGDADPATGLETLGKRVYDTVSGRFLSPDDIIEADPTQINGYDYAGNNPATGSDPTGQMRMMIDGGPAPYVPQGLTPQQFSSAMDSINNRIGNLDADVVVQGSRAAYTARPDSDIDFAIRVEPRVFHQIWDDSFTNQRTGSLPNVGSDKEDTAKHALATGKIQAGEARIDGYTLKNLRKALQEDLGMKVDISVIEIGGPFDNPPFIRPGGGPSGGGGSTEGGGGGDVGGGGAAAEGASGAKGASTLAKVNDVTRAALESPVAKWGGRMLFAAGIASDIYDVATAPPAQKVKVAAKDTAELAGGWAGAEAGAAIGAAVGGPVGAVVGGVVGGIVGSGAGGMVVDGVENAWNSVSSWF